MSGGFMQPKHYLRLARFPEALFLPSFAVTTSYLVAAKGIFAIDMWIPILAGTLGTAGMCALNDYFDFQADKIGAQNRPLPSGKISLPDGLSFAIILTTSGMAIAGLSHRSLLPVIGAAAVILGLLYNWKTKGKGVWGTITFGLIMVTVVLLGMVQANINGFDQNHLYFLLFIFNTAAANQSTANFYDFKSDRAFGYRTLANIYGLKKSAGIVTVIRYSAFGFLVLFLFSTGNEIGLSTLFFLAILSGLPAIAYYFMTKADNRHLAKRAFKLGVIWTLFSFCTILLTIYTKS
ncbi:hypothetical protein GF406_14325 [candidate division KSB1 bacterium]|nr:hypothetical protein [candidate division KSB1 bacterium]